MEFEWDERKRLINLEKHDIDFRDAVQIWAGYIYEKPTARDFGELRIVAHGVAGGEIITVVYTWRGEVRRLISARKARNNEQRDYYEGYARDCRTREDGLGSSGRPH